MKIVVIANEAVKEQLPVSGSAGDDITWYHELGTVEDVDVLIDLLFQPGPDRVRALQRSGAELVIINYVSGTLEGLPSHFIRINGWPGFLKGEIIEAAGMENARGMADKIFALFGKKAVWLPDRPGFVSARVIAMIINEAYLALAEGISSRNDIDTAMKLGTGYPYGPFEWAKEIGPGQVYELLVEMSKIRPGFQPAALLAKEALS